MRSPTLWAQLLGVQGCVVEAVHLDQGRDLVVRVRIDRRRRRRCGICGRRMPGYDEGGRGDRHQRRWRALDLGFTRCYLEADAPRVRCSEHGVVVGQVPWADHGARSTRSFDEQVAWLAVRCDQTAVSELMRISWRTVGWILARISRRLRTGVDQLDGLRRIGIDEIAFRRGHRYLIVVVDHDSGRLVWAAEGRDEKTLWRFFDELGTERCQQLTHVSADAALWISRVVAFRCPHVIRCMDPFHVVKWATDALDQVRREVWNAARRAGDRQAATYLKGARWTLWKGAEHLSNQQFKRLEWIEETNQPLYRGYLLKEHLRLVFQLPSEEARELLKQWLEWAVGSGLEPFIKVARLVEENLVSILNTLGHRLTNALVEALNTRLRLLTRRAFGFHSAAPLIGLAMLSFGGLQLALPGRA